MLSIQKIADSVRKSGVVPAAKKYTLGAAQAVTSTAKKGVEKVSDAVHGASEAIKAKKIVKKELSASLDAICAEGKAKINIDKKFLNGIDDLTKKAPNLSPEASQGLLNTSPNVTKLDPVYEEMLKKVDKQYGGNKEVREAAAKILKGRQDFEERQRGFRALSFATGEKSYKSAKDSANFFELNGETEIEKTLNREDLKQQLYSKYADKLAKKALEKLS